MNNHPVMLRMFIVLAAASAASLAAEPSVDLNRLLKAAKPGDVVSLPAGTFRSAIVLPEGVSLRGAGYGRTIIDAGAAATAITIRGGKGAGIEDLTAITKGMAAVSIENAAEVSIRRIVVRGGAVGIRLESVERGRIENTIVDGSMSGILLNRSQFAAVVNCTLVGNAAVGVGISDTRCAAVFNNLILDAATGIVIGGENGQHLAVDHNLYVASFVGKINNELARPMLGPWRDVSRGLDAHSVQLPVQLAEIARGDYRPVSRLDWAPWQSTASDWGTREFLANVAPEKDIDGRPRIGAVDVGAYEVPPLQAVPDGAFTVAADEGTKSAGLFAPDGRLIRYLFHDLPLKKGTYGYVLPARTQLGDAVPAGDAELRLVEGNLRWIYRGIVANNGLAGSARATDEQHTQHVCFSPDGSLLLGVGWNERGENVRCFDYRTRQVKWVFPGQSDMHGLCVGGDGVIHCLRASGKGQYSLVKLDPRNGEPLAWPDGQFVLTLNLDDARLEGMAELDGKLYVADPAGNRVFVVPLASPSFDKSLAVPSPARPAADRSRRLLWLASNAAKLIAIDPSGKTIAESGIVNKPLGVALRGNRMAVASGGTGKVHFLDCSEPARLKPAGELGRGDGPFGPILPDRFYFQDHPYGNGRSVVLDLDEKGGLAVRDYFTRVLVFDAAGKAMHESFAQFGNYPVTARFDGDTATRFFDSSGEVSWLVDAKAGTWRPEAHWGFPRGYRRDAAGFFTAGGQRFGVFKFQPEEKQSGVVMVRLEGFVGRPVAYYAQEDVVAGPGAKPQKMWVVRRDSNRDGNIDSTDAAGVPVLDAAGQPVTWNLNARFMFIRPDGCIVCPAGIAQPEGIGFAWKPKGLDADGHPVFEFSADGVIPVAARTVPSAYDFARIEDLANQSEAAFAANGDYLATFQFRASPHGMGLSNSGGVDLARFDSTGRMKWLRPLNDVGPVQGVKTDGNFILSSWGHQAEWFGMSEDGLGLGHLGFPPEAGWTGYWVDHPTQYHMFRGNDGGLHVLTGDYMQNAQHWLTLLNASAWKGAKFPVRIPPERAYELAFRPADPYRTSPKPPQPRITVKRLGKAMPIDGKLDKWRTITPQIIVTPVTGRGIDGPRDASAVIRLAYQGQDLYVQVLRFDDVVSFHQPSSKTHQQDCLEMALNGFFDGFQFTVGQFTDTGPAIVRRRFFLKSLEDRPAADHAPRVVAVLPNAKDVTERKLIESIHGVDLADAKVIVTEFKLPIDKVTYRNAEGDLFPVRSGAGVWIGFAINDNDTPGSDVQEMLVWPATYGTFEVKERGVWAVFE